MAADPKRAKEIFLAATELSGDTARTAFLNEACAGDAELRARVDALLQSHDPATSFLEVPAVAPNSDFATQAFLPTGAEPAQAPGPTHDESLAFLAPATRPDALGRIGRYEMLQVLGRGGFGVVFRAYDTTLERVVAVKVLAPQLAVTSPARKRFLREAQTSAKVRHENVVQVYEVGDQPLPYLVMEFIPGETLQQRLDRVGPVEPAEVVRIARQIAEGLAAAHATDLIHRDVKPGNILLEGGRLKVKITDFGLARAADDASISQSGIIAGTPMYMAPEQALGHKLDHRADLFSLGSVMYQMAVGRPPFRASGTLAVLKRVVEDQPRDMREIIPETPKWLCDIVAKLHAKGPGDRYQSAREVADLLAECEAQLKNGGGPLTFAPKPAAPTPPPAAAPSRTRGWKIAALVAVPVVVVAAALIPDWTKEQRPTPRLSSNVAAPLPPTFVSAFGIEFVRIPKGKAWLGGGAGKPGDVEVEIPADFYLGKYEVTQGQWKKVMGENPSYFSRTGVPDSVKGIDEAEVDQFPVENVSFEECRRFVAKLNEKEPDADWVYRMPTEVEWEYAYRGGPMSDQSVSGFTFHFATPTNSAALSQANLGADAGKNRTCRVGGYEPNALGLHDMIGNVAEYCDDALKGPDGVAAAAARGGGWNVSPDYVASVPRAVGAATYRHFAVGFRLARAPKGTTTPVPPPPPAPGESGPFGEADIARIAALPPEAQVTEVMQALARCNPGFDPANRFVYDADRLIEAKPTIEGGAVVGLTLAAEHLKDLTPLRALTQLRGLDLRSKGGPPDMPVSPLTDLSPLRSLRLESLSLLHVPVSDLSPLKDMPLRTLHALSTRIADLSPLSRCPLVSLGFETSKVSDLRSVGEMKNLEILGMGLSPIEDLSPLKDLKLRELFLPYTRIKDLSPIKSMRLTALNIHATGVTDLSPLEGMPIDSLCILEVAVKDTSSLAKLPKLNGLQITFDAARDAQVLRSHKSLRMVNGMPVADFLAGALKK